ncbi:MAG: hypothetical protein DMG01_03845 [Acidobacteria bacterium]|nr:MAG: hypothetical protein DMG01_03845 [Acidobacteriota bacterium]
MSLRCRLLSAVIVAAVTAAACGDPPDKEIQQAQGAIDAAKAAGADLYARDELAAAEKAVKDANTAVNDRDYRLALNNALANMRRPPRSRRPMARRRRARTPSACCVMRRLRSPKPVPA